MLCCLVLFVAQNCTVCLLLPLVVRVVVVQFQPSATPSDGMNCTMIAVHALHPLFIESYAEEKEEQGETSASIRVRYLARGDGPPPVPLFRVNDDDCQFISVLGFSEFSLPHHLDRSV